MPASQPSAQLLFVPPENLTKGTYAGLLESFVSPAQLVLVPNVLAEIVAGDRMVFVLLSETTTVYFLVSIQYDGERALAVDAVFVERGQGVNWTEWLGWLAKLAEEWNCSKISTSVQNDVQLKKLLRLGCKIEYTAIYLELNNGHETHH